MIIDIGNIGNDMELMSVPSLSRRACSNQLNYSINWPTHSQLKVSCLNRLNLYYRELKIFARLERFNLLSSIRNPH